MRVSSPNRTGNASAASACSAAVRSAARCGSDRSSRSSGWSSSQSWARTTAIGRPTRPATCSLPSPANVSTVHSVVSIARSAAVERGLRGRRRPVAVLHVGGDEPGRQPAERQLAAGEPELRTGVRRSRPAGRDLPHDPAADGFVRQLADRVARPVEDLQRLVEVVGEEEAGHRVDGAGRVDLVDPGLGGLDSPTGVDQAEHPPRRPRQPGPEAEAGGRAVDLVAGRHRGRDDRGQVERPPERVEQPRLRHPDAARGEQLGRGRGRGRDEVAGVGAGALEAVAGVHAQQLEPDAVERGGHQVQLLDRARQRGQRRLDVVGHVTDAAGRLLQRILGGEEVPHRGGHRAGRAGREQRSAGGRGRRRGRRVTSGSGSRSTASSTQPPHRVGQVELGLPLEPGRHPWLRPRRDADRRRLGPHEHRVAEQLVGEVGLLEPPGRRRRRAPGWTRRRPRRRRSAWRPRRRAGLRSGAGQAAAAGGDVAEPAPLVGRVQDRLLGEVQHLGGDRAVAQRRQHGRAGEEALQLAHRLVRPTGTRAGRPARLGRRGRGAGCATRPGPRPSGRAGSGSAARAGARAAARCWPAGRPHRRRRRRPRRTSVPVISARRSRKSFDRRTSACSCTCSPSPAACRDAAARPGPPDRERRAALTGQEAVVAADPAGQRAEGDVVLVLLHGHGAVGRTDLAQQLPGERTEEPLRVAPLLVGRGGEPAHGQRTDHVVVVAAERHPHARRPTAGCRRRARDRAPAAARRRRCRAGASRAATTGSPRTPRWPCRPASSGSGSSSPRCGWSATGGAGGGRSFGSRTNRLADVRLTAARRAATSSWERWYAGVSTHGVTALQPNAVQERVEAVGVVGGVERVQRRVRPPARHHVRRGVAGDAVRAPAGPRRRAGRGARTAARPSRR